MTDIRIPPLKLRVGDLVEIRGAQEILASLDQRGALDGMPFMPEMLKFCGQRFRVAKRADKTCNTITVMESRRIHGAVHLEGLRCDGEAHGGCQAQCFLFWKEAWLKRVGTDEPDTLRPASHVQQGSAPLLCNLESLQAATRSMDSSNASEIVYRCQSTDLLKASESLPWWDVRQYFRDVSSGNVGLLDLAKAALFNIFRMTLRITAYRAQMRLFNRFQAWRGG